MDYVYQEYPKWKYHRDSGKAVVVADKLEEEDLGEGWSDTAEPKAQEAAPMESDTRRADLLKQADELGVKIDKRWSDDRIAEEIAKAAK